MKLLSCADVAEYIGTYRQRVLKMYKYGKLPEPFARTYKYNYPLWTTEQIDKWLEKQEENNE